MFPVRPFRQLGVLLLGSVLATGCDRAPQVTTSNPTATQTANQSSAMTTATPWRFRASAAASGFDFVYRNGEAADRFAIVESLGGGLGLCDIDLDGWLDVVCPGGGAVGPGDALHPAPTGCFRQQPGTDTFINRAREARIAPARHYSHGVACADYDEDGFVDCLITGYGGVQLWRNLGDGTFADVGDQAGLLDRSWSSSSAWGDLNGDGFLDLYVAHYVNWSFENDPVCAGRPPHPREVCAPRRFDPLPDQVWFSRGDGTFDDATAFAGLRADGKGLGVILSDVDADRDLDVYVTNDTVENFLYLNDGQGRLEDVSVLSGTAYSERGLPDGSMGVDLFDADNDGLPDLFVTNFEGENSALYRNQGQGLFRHVSQQTGLAAIGQMYVGWGVRGVDLDSDGDRDVVISNGHVSRFPAGGDPAQRPVLFRNQQGTFVNVAAETGGYFAEPHRGRGLATGDLNRDGRVDFAFAAVNEPATLVWNEIDTAARPVRVTLIGRRGPRTPIGATVSWNLGATPQRRQLAGGGSYESASDLAIDVTRLSDAEPVALEVTWPQGPSQLVELPAGAREVLILEGLAAPVPRTAGL